MMRFFRILAGLLLLSLGMAGLVLPVLQGWLFLSLGILVLSIDIPLFARFICWVENHWPFAHRVLHRMRTAAGKRKKSFPPCAPKA